MDNSFDRILVVDDDPDIGIMIKTILEYHGYVVTVISKADQAEEMLRTGSFGLLIMDMLLSGVNGVDICSGLKQDPTTGHVPVIMISAHPNAQKLCRDAGAEDFISKPFEMQEILAKIEKYVPRKGA